MGCGLNLMPKWGRKSTDFLCKWLLCQNINRLLGVSFTGHARIVPNLSSSSKIRLDNDIVQETYRQHAGALERFLMGVLSDPASVSDVMQIAFTRLLEQGGGVKRSSLKSWLFRVAYNEAMMVHRKHKVDQRAKERISWQIGSGGDTENEGFAAMDKKEDAVRVRQALETLPPEQNQIVQLRIREGLKFAEIAERLNVPLGTVLTRMRSGLKKLKNKLE